LQAQIERLRRRGTQEAVGPFQGFQKLLFFRVVPCRLASGLERLDEELVALLEALLRHALRWLHRQDRLRRLRDEERAVSAAEEARGLERLDLESLAAGGALADVDERRYVRVFRPEGAGDDGAQVRRGDGLRRHVTGVPVVLVARVEDEAEVAGLEGLD